MAFSPNDSKHMKPTLFVVLLSMAVQIRAADSISHTDPNTIQFAIEAANNYVNASYVSLILDVTKGVPSSVAILVDNKDLAGATWSAYTSPNITVNLGSTQGWHEIWVGLRGRQITSQQMWILKRLKLDTSPPQITITSPTNNIVNLPTIQILGYSPEALLTYSYDITNSTGLLTNQQVLVMDANFDMNTFENTTTYFQCFNVRLALGTNQLTLHAEDLTGNVTATNFNFVLDYSSKTNPPVLEIDWLKNGDYLSGSNFVVSGRMNDPTATISASIVDSAGTTNEVPGMVGLDGEFETYDLPLSSGTNYLTLTATDVLSQTTTTNLTLIKSSVLLTVNKLTAGQTTVTGTINTGGHTVWVNGVQATITGTNWTVEVPPVGLEHGWVEVTTVPNGGSQ